MTPDRSVPELLDLLDESRPMATMSPERRAAEAVVDALYDAWRRRPGPDAYQRYLDAERRAEGIVEQDRTAIFAVAPPRARVFAEPAGLVDRLVGAV